MLYSTCYISSKPRPYNTKIFKLVMLQITIYVLKQKTMLYSTSKPSRRSVLYFYLCEISQFTLSWSSHWLSVPFRVVFFSCEISQFTAGAVTGSVFPSSWPQRSSIIPQLFCNPFQSKFMPCNSKVL